MTLQTTGVFEVGDFVSLAPVPPLEPVDPLDRRPPLVEAAVGPSRTCGGVGRSLRDLPATT